MSIAGSILNRPVGTCSGTTIIIEPLWPVTCSMHTTLIHLSMFRLMFVVVIAGAILLMDDGEPVSRRLHAPQGSVTDLLWHTQQLFLPCCALLFFYSCRHLFFRELLLSTHSRTFEGSLETLHTGAGVYTLSLSILMEINWCPGSPVHFLYAFSFFRDTTERLEAWWI